jgi:deazaflavin-dependent oxidoreductase (nitroreductase family)
MSDKPDWNDWNKQVIAEFRANEGKVGGRFEGAPVVLMHHHGRKSGNEFVTPVMYLQSETDPDAIYVFASKGGAPDDPDWYHNLLVDEAASVEVGTETYPVTVSEIVDAERDTIYAEQVKRYPGFGEYEVATAGIRTIPVLALTRVRA